MAFSPGSDVGRLGFAHLVARIGLTKQLVRFVLRPDNHYPTSVFEPVDQRVMAGATVSVSWGQDRWGAIPDQAVSEALDLPPVGAGELKAVQSRELLSCDPDGS